MLKRPPYVPPLMGSRPSHAAAALVEPDQDFPQDFASWIEPPTTLTELALDLGGLRIGVSADAATCAFVRERWAPFVVPAESLSIQLTIRTHLEYSFETQLTRLRLEERAGNVRAMNRGLLLDGNSSEQRYRLSVLAGSISQDLSNALRFILHVHAPAADALLVHAAAIERPYGAVLFVGASGSGKTTLAGLCARELVLSDDCVLVRVRESGVTLCTVGLWGGEDSSPSSRRVELPLRAVVALRKRRVAELTTISRAVAATELAAVIPSPITEAGRQLRLLDLVSRVVAEARPFVLHFARTTSDVVERLDSAFD